MYVVIMDSLNWIKDERWELIVFDCDYMLKDFKYYISISFNYI